MKNICYTFAMILTMVACDTTPVEKVYELPETRLSSDRPNLNLSILLDLSDRINPEKYPNGTMSYNKRDLGYIATAASAFQTHLVNKKLHAMDDHIQLFPDPLPSDPTLNTKLQALKMHFTKDNTTKERIVSMGNTYKKVPLEIYEQTIKDRHYIGSDIWRFFKNNVNDLCVLPDADNVLMILTDGYLYHENTLIKEGNATSYLTPQFIKREHLLGSDWKTIINEKGYGYLPAQKELSKLRVLVIGIHPSDQNPYEEDIIKYYWAQWFTEMGIVNYEIKSSALPSQLNDIIAHFIWNQ